MDHNAERSAVAAHDHAHQELHRKLAEHQASVTEVLGQLTEAVTSLQRLAHQLEDRLDALEDAGD